MREPTAREKAEAAGRLIQENYWSDTFHLAVSKEEQANFWAIRKAAVPILYRLKKQGKINSSGKGLYVKTE